MAKKHRKVDFLGNKIKVGDEVVLMSQFDAKALCKGVISRFTETNLAVIDLDDKHCTKWNKCTKREPKRVVLIA